MVTRQARCLEYLDQRRKHNSRGIFILVRVRRRRGKIDMISHGSFLFRIVLIIEIVLDPF